jgi:hypothetical protein
MEGESDPSGRNEPGRGEHATDRGGHHATLFMPFSAATLYASASVG